MIQELYNNFSRGGGHEVGYNHIIKEVAWLLTSEMRGSKRRMSEGIYDVRLPTFEDK